MNSSPSYVFIAGGIGITPFRSIVSSLIVEKKEQKITLFYVVSEPKDILFADLFAKAQKEIGLKVIYIIGKKLTSTRLKKEHPKLTQFLYYLSGPLEMVETYRDMLIGEGVMIENIKMDSFTGYEN